MDSIFAIQLETNVEERSARPQRKSIRQNYINNCRGQGVRAATHSKKAFNGRKRSQPKAKSYWKDKKSEKSSEESWEQVCIKFAKRGSQGNSYFKLQCAKLVQANAILTYLIVQQSLQKYKLEESIHKIQANISLIHQKAAAKDPND